MITSFDIYQQTYFNKILLRKSFFNKVTAVVFIKKKTPVIYESECLGLLHTQNMHAELKNIPFFVFNSKFEVVFFGFVRFKNQVLYLF